MSDLKKYVDNRKKQDKEFAQDYDNGYNNFKIGAMLKEARLKAGMSQTELANKLHTNKTAISRIENHTHENIKLSTLRNFANMMGRELRIELV